jgi:hypothetical protein
MGGGKMGDVPECFISRINDFRGNLIWKSYIGKVGKVVPVLNYFFIISGVGLSPLGTAATSGLLYKPQMIDEDDRGAIGGMKIGRGNRSTRRKPCPSATLSTTNPT